MTPTGAREVADLVDEMRLGGKARFDRGRLADAVFALRSLADQVERQAEALTILDGFKGPPPTKDQWDGMCALARALKEVIAREAT